METIVSILVGTGGILIGAGLLAILFIEIRDYIRVRCDLKYAKTMVDQESVDEMLEALITGEASEEFLDKYTKRADETTVKKK